jgi:hypothetical protein
MLPPLTVRLAWFELTRRAASASNPASLSPFLGRDQAAATSVSGLQLC